MSPKEHFNLTDHELYLLLGLKEVHRRDVLSDFIYPFAVNGVLVFLMVFGALHEIGPMLFTGMFGVLYETIQGIAGRRRNRGEYVTLAEKIVAKSESVAK